MEEPDTEDALRAAIAAQRSSNARAAQALAETTAHVELLEQVIACVPGVVWADNWMPDSRDFRMMYVGGQGQQLLGYTRQDWQDDRAIWAKLIHPDDAERVKKRLSEADAPLPRDPQAAPNPAARVDEYRFLAKDGRVVWVEPRRQPLLDLEGKPIGRCGVVLDVTARKAVEQARAELLERSERLSRRLDEIIGSVPGVVWEMTTSTTTEEATVTFISSYITMLTGYLPSECMESPGFWMKLVHPEDRARAARDTNRIFKHGTGFTQIRWVTKDGRVIWVETHLRALRDGQGAPMGALGVTMDITAQRLSEVERARQKEEVIRAQATALLELSTPLIPISAEVMVMPLIGGVDRARAERVIEALLHGIRQARARFAIIDITGVPSVDAQTADALLRAARSALLLGIRVVLTGIRPEVAQAFVALGTDLQGIVTCGDLESGIAYATRSR